jgi:mannose-1-phosphate guanylyltransferase
MTTAISSLADDNALPSNVWALVLAAGEGSRLRALTTRPCGTSVPKQFCSLNGGETLLEDAIARASGLVAPERICTIVAQQHREWWSQVLRHMPEKNIIVQPRNRGTAIGILYSLLHILARDPKAKVVLLPADHYVREESKLRRSLQLALERLDRAPSSPVLLGLEPEETDPELGYILPGAPDELGGLTVRRFVEKPELGLAAQIIDAGGLWNAFIIAASAQQLVNMFTHRFAPVVMEMQVILSRYTQAGLPATSGWATIVDMYERLPTVDFSRDLLEGQEASLRVVHVPACGWSDLGTPHRVAETVRRLSALEAGAVHRPRHRNGPSVDAAPINLAAMHARFESGGMTA